MKNILLIIVDCLRNDYVTEERMPFLYKLGEDNLRFCNHWSTSHCTDPGITHMLSGCHPDKLRLYSMLQEHPQYQIPKQAKMLAQYAVKHGFSTAMVSNLGRWYKRGVQAYMNSRGMPDRESIIVLRNTLQDLQEPWFAVWHTVGMHRPYMGGSYAAAALIEDAFLAKAIRPLDDAYILVTSDHGEGLGEKGIQQHGYGLWDFLTHVPLIVKIPGGSRYDELPGHITALTDHETVFDIISTLFEIQGGIAYDTFDYVFQAGDTPPDIRHRGAVAENGDHFITENKNGRNSFFAEPDGLKDDRIWLLEGKLSDHCERYGIDYEDEVINEEIVMRLKGLGYWKDD